MTIQTMSFLFLTLFMGITFVEQYYLPNTTASSILIFMRLYTAFFIYDLVKSLTEKRIDIGNLDWMVGFMIWLFLPAFCIIGFEKSDSLLFTIEQMLGYFGIVLILGVSGYVVNDNVQDILSQE